MLEPASQSHHPVGDYLRAAAAQLDKTGGLLRWGTMVGPSVAGPLAAWLRSAAEDAEHIGADVQALAVADVILGGIR